MLAEAQLNLKNFGGCVNLTPGLNVTLASHKLVAAPGGIGVLD
jgi:hypothetical protein